MASCTPPPTPHPPTPTPQPLLQNISSSRAPGSYNSYNLCMRICEFCVKTGDGISRTFSSTTGVKQGCNLNPTVSNVFQNDLYQIFDENCQPLDLQGIRLNFLSWADDPVLVSSCLSGLQRCLGQLSMYCKKWSLQVNHSKTKCMIMSHKYKTKESPFFTYDQNVLEVVDSYKYLGINLSSTGSYKVAITNRTQKAQKAINMCKQVLTTNGNVSCSLSMKIFDKQLLPILTYGSIIWGIPASNKSLHSDNIT